MRISTCPCAVARPAGNVVSLRDALNGSHFAYLPLYHASELAVSREDDLGRGPVVGCPPCFHPDIPAMLQRLPLPALQTRCPWQAWRTTAAAAAAATLPSSSSIAAAAAVNPASRRCARRGPSGPSLASPRAAARQRCGWAGTLRPCCLSALRRLPCHKAPTTPPPVPLARPHNQMRQAQAKRHAIRRTWKQAVKDHVPGATVKFILAQVGWRKAVILVQAQQGVQGREPAVRFICLIPLVLLRPCCSPLPLRTSAWRWSCWRQRCSSTPTS